LHWAPLHPLKFNTLSGVNDYLFPSKTIQNFITNKNQKHYKNKHFLFKIIQNIMKNNGFEFKIIKKPYEKQWL